MFEANFPFVIFIVVYVFQVLFSTWLEGINLKHLQRYGNRIPEFFEGFIDAARLSDMNTYTRSKTRLEMAETFFTEAVLLVLILSGFITSLENDFSRWQLPFAIAGPLFFLLPAAILYVVALPFSFCRSFVIEKKYGFHRSSPRMWILDQIKSGIISIVIFSFLLILILWLMHIAPAMWWFWGFLAVSTVQILLALLYPVLIAPLFNKFEPLQDLELAETIRTLMDQNGIRVKNILQMDAGKRSSHTNAYFTGFGRTKQIVLFDTLIESHPREEILAVLAHEAGHYQRRHIIKQIAIFEIFMFTGFYLTYHLMNWPALYAAFGFQSMLPYAGLFIVGIFWQKAGFFLQPFYMAVSRHFERQADAFATGFLQTAVPLITALKRMAKDNLSNLAPHPLYVWFHYSHPPLVRRITLLEETERDITAQQEKTGKDRTLKP
ncbi:MAG: M48 family metallopeptidase [Syntrophobacteraceae bacterium]